MDYAKVRHAFDILREHYGKGLTLNHASLLLILEVAVDPIALTPSLHVTAR